MPNCKQCESPFDITPEDLTFYDKVSPVFNGKKYLIPPPTLCPECRTQRKMVWRNEMRLYRRKCDLCHKEGISYLSPELKMKGYCPACYYSDRWDPMDSGREFDFDRPFFDQFKDVLRQTPTLALSVNNNENCEFTNQTSFNKDCYLIFAASKNEGCFNSFRLLNDRDVSDCFFMSDSELCYECVDCVKCYHLLYSQGCQNCSNSQWLFNCRGCSDCLGCVNLNNKQYHIFNKPYPKEDYEKKRDEILADSSRLEEAKRLVHKLKLSLPHKYYWGSGNEHFTGDYLSNSKNALECYDCSAVEQCRYCSNMLNSKDCYDCNSWGMTGELGYENITCGDNFYRVIFSESCWEAVSDLGYCSMCMHNSRDLFGCVGLRKKRYCILNKQYTKEEYEALVPRIIEHMRKTPSTSSESSTGEWGEFFPVSLSPFAYNETIAQHYYPLAKSAAVQRGYAWSDYEMPPPKASRIIPASLMGNIPLKIEETPDDIVNWALTCENCGKLYKLIAQELALYRKLGVPAPKKCSNCRHEARSALHNPRHLWSRICAKCGTGIQTTYAPDRPETVYCEECYLKEVY